MSLVIVSTVGFIAATAMINTYIGNKEEKSYQEALKSGKIEDDGYGFENRQVK